MKTLKKLFISILFVIFGLSFGMYLNPNTVLATAECNNQWCNPGDGCKEFSLEWKCDNTDTGCEHQTCGTQTID